MIIVDATENHRCIFDNRRQTLHQSKCIVITNNDRVEMLFAQFGTIKRLQLTEEVLALTTLGIEIQHASIELSPLKLLGETTLDRVSPEETLVVRVNNEDFLLLRRSDSTEHDRYAKQKKWHINSMTSELPRGYPCVNLVNPVRCEYKMNFKPHTQRK